MSQRSLVEQYLLPMKTIWDRKGRRKRVPFESEEIRELEMFPRHEKQNRVASNTEITQPQAQFARQKKLC